MGVDVVAWIADLDPWKIVLLGFLVLFHGWMIVSMIVFVWWFFNLEKRDRFSEWTETTPGLVFAGAFCGLVFVLYIGTEQLFAFIPGSWGTYAEDSIPTRDFIAITLGGLLSLFFVHVFHRFYKIREVNRRLLAKVESLEREIEILHDEHRHKQK